MGLMAIPQDVLIVDDLKSYLDLSKDEEEHALVLHNESFVIDASLVAFLEGVGEDIWIDDVLKGGVTAGNATVCMGRSFSGALRELAQYHDWQRARRTRPSSSRRPQTSRKRRRRESTASSSAPRIAASWREASTSSRSPTSGGYGSSRSHTTSGTRRGTAAWSATTRVSATSASTSSRK